jgi:Spy/CpxP family protein refolding chaperone
MLSRENPTTGFIHKSEERDMSEEVADENSTCHGGRKHRLGRRVRLTLGALTLVAVGAVLGAGATAQAGRMGSWPGFGHHGGFSKTEEQVRERAADQAAWLLGRIDASPEQETRINDIVGSLVGDLYPLRGEHREYRRQLITELARPQIDAQALERIRANGMALASAASKTLMNAIVDVSEVLSVAQRQELAASIGRRRH